MNQAAIDGTVRHRGEDAETSPFLLQGPTDLTVHRICACLGPAGVTPRREFALLIEDPYATADRVDLVESIRHQRPEVLVVPVEDIRALAAARKPAYAADVAWLMAQRKDDRRTCRPSHTSNLPVDRDRSTADGLAIVAAALALAERYAAAARRCRKPENRAARALHAVDALESARAGQVMFELGTRAVVPAFVTLAPGLWHAVADRYREIADAAAARRDPTDDDVEALTSLVD